MLPLLVLTELLKTVEESSVVPAQLGDLLLLAGDGHVTLLKFADDLLLLFSELRLELEQLQLDVLELRVLLQA